MPAAVAASRRSPGAGSSIGSIGDGMSSIGGDGNNTLALIQRELTALQEAKHANEQALKDALYRKQYKKQAQEEALLASGGGSGSPIRDRSGLAGSLRGTSKLEWERAIIEDELSRPLEVTEAWVRELTVREAETESKLLTGLSKHQESLHALRTKLLERELVAEHNFAYKTAKSALGARPETIEEYKEIEKLDLYLQQQQQQQQQQGGGSSVTARNISPSRQSTRSAAHTAALSSFTAAESHVLDSLARLEELEGRISDLEHRAAGADLAELLGISLPAVAMGMHGTGSGDGGTGGASASDLRSAYAPMRPVASAASSALRSKDGRRSVSPSGAARSVFSTGSKKAQAVGGGGGTLLPAVGIAPVLGVVYTKKRILPQNGVPGKTVYTVERLEDATERRGIGGGLSVSPNSYHQRAGGGGGGGAGSYSSRIDAPSSSFGVGGGYTYDADTDPYAAAPPASYSYGGGMTPIAGDTGGSASGRNTAASMFLHSTGGGGDGDDEDAAAGGGYNNNGGFYGQQHSHHHPNQENSGHVSIPPILPIETSDAIDKWLAAKQRQIAKAVSAREGENLIKTNLKEVKAGIPTTTTTGGSKIVGGGGSNNNSGRNGGGATSGAKNTIVNRGRPGAAGPAATLTTNANTRRLTNSLPPMGGSTATSAGSILARGRQPNRTGSGGGGGGDFKRRAGATVAVGTNISKVVAQERARAQARNARAGSINASSMLKKASGPGVARVERSSARIAIGRATLSQFQDVRKKFEATKGGTGSKGASKAATSSSSSSSSMLSPSRGAAVVPGRSVSNPRGGGIGRPGGGVGGVGVGATTTTTTNNNSRSTSNPAGGGGLSRRAVSTLPPGRAGLDPLAQAQAKMAAPPVVRKSLGGAGNNNNNNNRKAPAAVPKLGIIGGTTLKKALVPEEPPKYVGHDPLASTSVVDNARALVLSTSVPTGSHGNHSSSSSHGHGGTTAAAASRLASTTIANKKLAGPLGGKTIQLARANFGAGGVRMSTLQQKK